MKKRDIGAEVLEGVRAIKREELSKDSIWRFRIRKPGEKLHETTRKPENQNTPIPKVR